MTPQIILATVALNPFSDCFSIRQIHTRPESNFHVTVLGKFIR